MIRSGSRNSMPTISDTISRQPIATSRLGRLDPHSGTVRYFSVPGAATALMEIASDPRGMIWATSFSAGLLVSLNPATGVITPYYAPSPDGNTGGLYGITITPSGE